MIGRETDNDVPILHNQAIEIVGSVVIIAILIVIMGVAFERYCTDRLAIEDMMERKECSSRKTGLERLWRSRRWRLVRKLDSEEEEKDRRMPREKIER
jgi:hypothetical protein